ncbi:MAG: hypothetical protein NC223_08665 [Butyrivibrio sp.]|nr:hypothetical protein [Butyrivibrio sp.]
MSKYENFEELKNARLKAYTAMVEGDVLGFLDQHTGFYPDPAHFIYELLQNAEDMNATEVTFRLFSDRLIFEHNGTKRDFNLDDIDAITNKGKSPKANDPTQIGKFGMGFKAVYVYTNTPEIHSGEFNFRIKNVIVPNDDGVPQTARKNFTQFIFPFDNPNKSAKDAVKEIIQEGFDKLNETALLFLTHIKIIHYYLPNGSEGYISIESKILNIRFLYAITVKKPNLDKTATYWARFSDDCPIMVSDKDSNNKAVKSFPVAVAYRLNKSEDNVFTLDSSLVGKICLFFPTEMDSLLHFHINAPFASTVARDVILSKGEDGEANDKLINKLADLAAESLHWFKKAKMLDYAAYSTLPILRDYNNQLNSRYKIFATRIKKEFENEELFITKDGKYCSINDIYKAANKELLTILPIEFVEKLYQKSWIPTVPSVTKIEYFIDQFDIEEYTIENFIDSLEKDNTFFDELFAVQNNREYFKTLYYLFSQSKDRETNKYYGKPTRNEILHKVNFLICEDKNLHSIEDSLFLRTEYHPKHYIKNPIYINISLKNSTQDKAIKQFLLSLGIKEMCEREDLIADVSGESVPVDDMILKIMEIIECYKKGTINIDEFIDSPIFIAVERDDDETESIYKVKAADCCWSDTVSFFFQKTQYTLAQGHYQVIGEDLPILKEFFAKLGGKVEPKIVESKELSPYNFPLYHLLKNNRERCDTCLKSTYTIDGFDWSELKNIEKENLLAESLLLWKVVLHCNDSDCLLTKYRPNYSTAIQKLESTIVYYLKRTAWIPTQSGTFKCPFEITKDDLLDDFRYDKPSVLLSEISKKPDDAVEQLKSKGIEDEDVLAFAQYSKEDQKEMLALMQEKKRQRTGKSLTELAATSDRIQSPEYGDDDDYGVFHKPKNIEKRKLKLEKEFDDRDAPPTYIRKLQFVLEKPDTNEKTFVRNEYHSHCQLCGNEGILTAKGKRYFEAINIFNTGKLDDSLQINLDLGWNTLCLCPNCAAKFKYSQLTISGLIEQVERINISAVQSAFVDVSITLEGKPTTIRFTPKHLLSLQIAIKKLKEIEAEEN